MRRDTFPVDGGNGACNVSLANKTVSLFLFRMRGKGEFLNGEPRASLTLYIFGFRAVRSRCFLFKFRSTRVSLLCFFFFLVSLDRTVSEITIIKNVK